MWCDSFVKNIMKRPRELRVGGDEDARTLAQGQLLKGSSLLPLVLAALSSSCEREPLVSWVLEAESHGNKTDKFSWLKCGGHSCNQLATQCSVNAVRFVTFYFENFVLQDKPTRQEDELSFVELWTITKSIPIFYISLGHASHTPTHVR